MISLLNFIDTGFIITLGLLLLISGAVMLYCYRRLNMLENSVIDHGKILQNFIMNYNNMALMGQQNKDIGLDNSATSGGSSNEMDNHREQKISVSDDDDDDDDDEDDDDDDDEDESDSDSDSEEDNHDEHHADALVDSIVEVEPDVVPEIKTKILNLFETIEIKDDIFDSIKMLDETLAVDINDPFTNNLPLDLQEFDLQHLAPKLSETVDTPPTDTTEKKNYKSKKVDELRTLVIAKNLTDNENVQQMKKADLLKLLQ
jgi:hypothetical protein